MEQEIDRFDDAAFALAALIDAFPRFFDHAVLPLAPDKSTHQGSSSPLAFVLRGPVKLIATLAKVTQASNATSVAERFKLLLPRATCLPKDELVAELAGAKGLDALPERFEKLDPATQFVAVIVGELEAEGGGLTCVHKTCGGAPASVPDTGPWLWVTQHGAARLPRMPGYSYTGTLRPYRVSPRRSLAKGTVLPDYHATGQPDAESSSPYKHTPPIVKPADEAALRRVCALGREIIDAAHAIVKPGVTTDEIDRVVHDKHTEVGAYPAPLNYYNFPKSCCTSVNEVVCHGIPDMRELEDGDIVNVDISPILDGWHSDLNETFCVGNVAQKTKDLVKASHDSLMKAIAQCKPGYFYRDIGGVVTKHVNGQGFSVDKNYCGHGIGQLFHCAPNIPHYAGNKAKFTMKPGHCFTIEPMINMGSWKGEHWPDGWTAVTKDGKPSAQFEHQILINETGAEVLTARTPDSPPLWWEV